MTPIFMILPILLYSFAFIIGFINFINPRWMWKTFESWKATKEPSVTFFRFRRITGLIVMVLITIVAFFPYVMSRIYP